MAKWEYKMVHFQANLDKNVWRVWMVNGQEVRDWKRGPSVDEYLNQLGEQGWELVGVEGLSHYFKRVTS